MLRNDVSYPYPVLRTFLSDYKETFFSSNITVETTQNGFRFFLDFSVNNDRINTLLREGILSYALYISCPRTFLREMRFLDPDTQYIEIAAEDVHYQVEYAAYIIAVQDIEHYADEDLSSGYEEMDFYIPKGSVFGIGRSGQFSALFDNDIIKDAGSIIQIQGSDNEKYMKVDLKGKTIIVWMPTEQSTMYKNMPKSKDKQNLLHAVVTIPALVEAISMIARTKDSRSVDAMELSEQPWFQTIKRAIEDLSEMTGESELVLYEYPLRTAQMIMKNNSATAIKLIQNMQ